jgi:tight adherence protein C
VLELVAVAIRAGGTVPAAVTLLDQRGPAVTGPAFRGVLARAAAGVPLAVALADLPGLLGEAYRPLAAALVSAEADGAPLVTVVSQLSLDAQQARRRLAESRARQVPVRLLLPLVCCTLPAVLAIAVVPLAIVGGGLPG